MERLVPQETDVRTLSPLALAFVGDGVYELMVRETLLSQATVRTVPCIKWQCRLCGPKRRPRLWSGCCHI